MLERNGNYANLSHFYTQILSYRSEQPCGETCKMAVVFAIARHFRGKKVERERQYMRLLCAIKNSDKYKWQDNYFGLSAHNRTHAITSEFNYQMKVIVYHLCSGLYSTEPGSVEHMECALNRMYFR